MNTLFTSLYHLKLHTPASVCWFLFLPTILTFLITWWIGFTYLCNRSNDNVIYLLEREAKTLNWFSQLYTHTHTSDAEIFSFFRSQFTWQFYYFVSGRYWWVPLRKPDVRGLLYEHVGYKCLAIHGKYRNQLIWDFLNNGLSGPDRLWDVFTGYVKETMIMRTI